MASRRIVLPGCLVLAVLLSLVAWLDRTSRPARPQEPTAVVSSRPLDVSLDPSGRPYDAVLPPHEQVVTRRLTVLHAPSRRVLFTGGEYVSYLRPGDAEPVELAKRPGDRYPLDAVWLDGRGTRLDRLVGIVLLERGTAVVRWRVLDRVAYGTDGGTGAITTPEWADRPKADDNQVSRLYERDLVDVGRQWLAADVDGTKGVDTVIFDNGFGDGGFPSVAGYDAAGRRVAIVLWSNSVPWRVAFPAGTPPPEVTRTENELAACLAGRRTVNGLRCRPAK